MMEQWVESWPKFQSGPRFQVLQQALAQRPNDPRLHILQGEALGEAKRHDEALEHFRIALRLAPELAAGWSGLATSLRKLGRAEEVIALCDDWRGDAREREFQRGRALIRLGDAKAGEAVLRGLLLAAHGQSQALRALLESLARSSDGREILATLEQLGPSYQATAAARAYRAVALSMLGEAHAARALIDLDRCVARYSFRPPPGLGGIDAFNDRLAEMILAATPADDAQSDTVLNYRTPLQRGTEIEALRAFFRSSMADYLRTNEAVLATASMPPPPRRAELSLGTVVLRRSGHNGQHIHPVSYLSAVYHVHVPERRDGDNSQDGALVLGPCDRLTGGHRACWGERYIPASSGWLTIFPSHVFHDVMPTNRTMPRISVVSDVIPAAA